MFFSSFLSIGEANYQAAIACYQFHLWENMTLFLLDLPDNRRRLARTILMEGLDVAKHALKALFDVSDSAARAFVLMADPFFTSFHKDGVVLRPDPRFFPEVVSDFHNNQTIHLVVVAVVGEFPKLHSRLSSTCCGC